MYYLKTKLRHRIGARFSRQSPDNRKILVKLCDEETKRDILSACRTVKPPDMFANDDLTPMRAKILYLLRQAKAKSGGKLVTCGSSSGNVYAFIKPPDSTSKNQKIYVKTMDKLESLCRCALDVSLADLVGGTNRD